MSLSLWSHRQARKGLAPLEMPIPCRMAPPRRSGRTPALPYLPWRQLDYTMLCRRPKALNSNVLLAKHWKNDQLFPSWSFFLNCSSLSSLERNCQTRKNNRRNNHLFSPSITYNGINSGIEWGILKVTGKYNYVTVKKITANPHAMLGKEFRTEDQAIANYKSMAMKVALVQTFAEL